jgi:fumarylacetoacetase
MTIDHTHDAVARSWVASADDHADFPVQNLPLGVFSLNGAARRIGTIIGDWILDLPALASAEALPEAVRAALRRETLNDLFARPSTDRLALRHALFVLLTSEDRRSTVEPHLHRAIDVTLHLPFAIGDYTDFYVGIHHATNIGKLFRPDNSLLPNYKHLPIGYHGRASSVRVSGTRVQRPVGQVKGPDADVPRFAPCDRLDYELELGVWISGHNDLGRPVPIADAWDRVGGMALLNDWSARDLQAWEYQPLGPFLAKNFLTTESPWVVTAEALAPFRVAPAPRPQGDPAPLPYLTDAVDQAAGALSIDLEVTLSSAAMRSSGMPEFRLSHGNAAGAMYWTVAQMVTHHASNGCDLHSGDLLGTGTLSGPTPESVGSLMELSHGGSVPITLPSGETRAFLADGDQLTLSARAVREGFRSIGFGSCSGIVAPVQCP